MSEKTPSGTETIHVRLLDEPVDVWRPVRAAALDDGCYRLVDQPIPPDERWEFGPGEEVVARLRGVAPDAFLAAVTRRDPAPLRKRA